MSDILPLPAIAKKQARVRRRSHWLIRIFVARWMDLGLSMTSACLPIRYAPSAVNMCYLHDPKLFITETKSGAWPAGGARPGRGGERSHHGHLARLLCRLLRGPLAQQRARPGARDNLGAWLSSLSLSSSSLSLPFSISLFLVVDAVHQVAAALLSVLQQQTLPGDAGRLAEPACRSGAAVLRCLAAARSGQPQQPRAHRSIRR